MLGLWHNEDVRLLGFVAMFHVSWLTLYHLESLLPKGPAYYAAWMFFFFWTIWSACLNAIVTHNALHVPLFRNRTCTTVFQLVLACTYGNPVTIFAPVHNRSHHKHMQTKKDLTRTTKVQYKWNFLNMFWHGSSWKRDALGTVFRFYIAQLYIRPQLVVQLLSE
jgi:fatty acid desaturase